MGDEHGARPDQRVAAAENLEVRLRTGAAVPEGGEELRVESAEPREVLGSCDGSDDLTPADMSSRTSAGSIVSAHGDSVMKTSWHSDRFTAPVHPAGTNWAVPCTIGTRREASPGTGRSPQSRLTGGLCGDRAATAREGVGHPLRAGELARDGAGRVGLNLRHLVAHEAVVALTPLEEVARLQRVVVGLVGLS